MRYRLGGLGMRRVSQLHPDGCGVACVAMIVGVSFNEARRCMFGHQEITTTRTRDIRKALREFGIASSRLVRSTPRTRYFRNLEQDAILKTRSRSDNDWHWIVWDGKHKKLLDPEKNKDDRYVRPPVTSFIAVRRK